MNRENSRISVVIPAFNREELLPATLLSLLNQSYPAHEIIVVDDGSTDGTAMAAEIFKSPVRVIRQSNAGPSAARNHGFRQSTGEFIHFFDSDDIALPNKHEVQVRELVATGADIAYGPWVKGRLTPQGFAAENAALQQRGLPHGDLIRELLTNWSIVPHACLFRRSIVEKSGGFPEHLFVAEDQFMFLRCLLAGAKVVHSPGTLELYRVNNNDKLSGSDSNRAMRLTHWAQFLIEAERECAKHGIEPLAWFGYRRRLWEAGQDLAKYDVTEPGIKAELSRLLDGRGPHAAYRLGRQFQRFRLGLRDRLGLGRAHACFQCGPLAAVQQSMLESLPL